MIKYFYKVKAGKNQEGYALVSAFLILFLMTAIGIWAMLTSTTESRLTGNQSEDHYMFYLSEQTVDRIISHLHYLDQGLFSQINGLNFPFEDASDQLAPIKVLEDSKPLTFTGSVGSYTFINNPLFNIDAWIDPENYEHKLERNLSRALAIMVSVTNRRTNYNRTFRVIVQPKSIWDFAYYSENHNPPSRSADSPCNQASSNWYNCQTVFHGPSAIAEDPDFDRGPDTVDGDIYLRNSWQPRLAPPQPDTAKFFARGEPHISGQVRWRSAQQFDLGTYSGGTYTNSTNQTKGGSITLDHPSVDDGMVSNARDVGMFDVDHLIDYTNPYFRANADIRLRDAGPNHIWRIIFMNHHDTNGDGTTEEGFVASAITRQNNNGSIDAAGDVGTMLLYRVPFSNQVERSCSLVGKRMKKRHECITTGAHKVGCLGGGELWAPGGGLSWSNLVQGSGVCSDLRRNVSVSDHTFGPYDSTDIEPMYNFMYVPSIGQTKPASCGSGTFNGIINVEGDVLISGIIDGRVTIVVNGDAIIDHEIEKEDYMQEVSCDDTGACTYNSPNDIDMLGIFATGDIIIPNSMTKSSTHFQSQSWDDDWSDPFNGIGLTATGQSDIPPLTDDFGNEDIHAVMVSFGYGDCTGTGSGLTCDTTYDIQEATDIKNFRVGIYTTPRTSEYALDPTAYPNDAPFGSGTWNDQENDSGTLTVIGAMIQRVPGRIGYDYHSPSATWANSTCTGSTGKCRFIGHRLELIYDDHLKYITPAFPRGTSANRIVPYGRGAYEIISWQELNDPALLTSDNW